MNRAEILSHIKSNPEVSVLIVGGGINGIGTFRDLALNGVDVRKDGYSYSYYAQYGHGYGGYGYGNAGEELQKGTPNDAEQS